MLRKYFIYSVKDKKEATGTDFYLYMADYFKSFGFECINTLKYGHKLLFLMELFALLKIPRKSLVLTTWPGFPRQLLIMDGLANNLRYKIVEKIKRLKKWKLVLLPVDLPLLQFQNRLTKKFIEKQQYYQDCYFEIFDFSLICGKELSKYFSIKHPKIKQIIFDLYCQPLKKNIIESKYKENVIYIVIAGNLARMTNEINLLPRIKGLVYIFSGPNGENIELSGREDFVWLGVIKENDLIGTLSNFTYGMILYSENEKEYFSKIIAGKLTTYVIASLPIICIDNFSSMRELIERKKIGLIINNLEDLNNIQYVCKESYDEMVKNCDKLQPSIVSGEIYLNALQKIL